MQKPFVDATLSIKRRRWRLLLSCIILCQLKAIKINLNLFISDRKRWPQLRESVGPMSCRISLRPSETQFSYVIKVSPLRIGIYEFSGKVNF